MYVCVCWYPKVFSNVLLLLLYFQHESKELTENIHLERAGVLDVKVSIRMIQAERQREVAEARAAGIDRTDLLLML